jgi:hypothetical protein
MVARSDIQEACETVIRNKANKGVEWSVPYAKECAEMCAAGAADDQIKDKARYVLGNILHWKDDAGEADRIRSTLKAYIEDESAS